MRICWFDHDRLGLVLGDRVHDVTEAVGGFAPAASFRPGMGDPLIAQLDALRPTLLAAAARTEGKPIREVRFLSPVAHPTKIIGTPVNYLKHVEEAADQVETFTQRYQGSLREQGLFLKANSALVGPGEGVHLRFPERRTDHEMELGVIIGRRVSNVSEAEAMDCIAGYALALDMVVRGPEDRSLRKSVDSYAVLGPWLITPDEVPDPGELDFHLSVNGETRQASNTRFMILDIAQQIAWASSFYTLWPGDITMTGTCEGVGQVKPGDVLDCHIEDVGDMQVQVFG